MGKTYQTYEPSVMEDLDEKDILAFYVNIPKLPCLINSPFRKDIHPSFNLYLRNGKIYYNDFATKEHGDLWNLLMRLWGCDYKEALARVCNDHIQKSGPAVSQYGTKHFSKHENMLVNIEVRVRTWQDYDIQYWTDYGVSLPLLKYAEVYPISHKTVIKTDKNTNISSKITFKADKFAYVFVERKENNLQLKIYQPYNIKGFKWCSKMDGSVLSLWTKIPEYGDKVVICSSLKDALCVRTQLGIQTLALQGEGYGISDTAVHELKRRYKKIYVSFDTDKAGLEDARTFAQRTGFINIVPDFGPCKDFSDYYKRLSDKDSFQQLKYLFN